MGLQLDVVLCFIASMFAAGFSLSETDDVKVFEVEVSRDFVLFAIIWIWKYAFFSNLYYYYLQ